MTSIEIYPDKKVSVLEDVESLIDKINSGEKMIKVTRHIFKKVCNDEMERVRKEFYINTDRILTIE